MGVHDAANTAQISPAQRASSRSKGITSKRKLSTRCQIVLHALTFEVPEMQRVHHDGRDTNLRWPMLPNPFRSRSAWVFQQSDDGVGVEQVAHQRNTALNAVPGAHGLAAALLRPEQNQHPAGHRARNASVLDLTPKTQAIDRSGQAHRPMATWRSCLLSVHQPECPGFCAVCGSWPASADACGSGLRRRGCFCQ